MTRRILVIEDDRTIAQAVADRLRSEGFAVDVAYDGRRGLEIHEATNPDLIVLDLMLPGVDGLEVCRRVHQRVATPVIMLTARDDEADLLVGLAVGADDYLTKPFSPRELVARIRAMLRRPRAGTTDRTARRAFGDMVIDPLGRSVRVDGEEVLLTRIEFDLLETLSSNPQMVFSRQLLRERVWGPEWFGDDHVVDVHIANLRKKVDPPDGRSRLRTVRGVGYRMEETG